MKKFLYHQWTLADIERRFEVSSKKGLSKAQVKTRLIRYGPNSFVGLKGTSALKILFRQFTNFFTIFLTVAAVISFFVEGWSQVIILVAIIIFNIAVGFFQEYKAEKSLQALKKSMSYKAKVLRDGQIIEINSEDLVPGDVALVIEGSRIPADIRLFEEDNLRVNEASLTGESSPISKNLNAVDIEAPLAERTNMLFSGSVVYSGKGIGVVVVTGRNTEYGKIAEMVVGEEEKTPLEKRVLYIGKYLSCIAFVITIIIFGLGLLRGWDILELITYVIAILVATVPESLPTVITLALAMGVMGMVRKKAVVRRLGVIEALGSINIIATDKTGTLTKNKLEVSSLAFLKKKSIYIRKPDKKCKSGKDLLYLAALCSDVSGNKTGNFIGDPLEVSIYETIYNIDRKKLSKISDFAKVNEVPFSSDKKYMVVTGDLKRTRLIIAKGATEKILKFCSLNKDEIEEIRQADEKITSRGSKVITVAVKKLGKRSASDLKSMEFVGIIGFSDELAEGVAEAIKQTQEAGIRPIIITGDNPKTAKYIADKIGLKANAEEIIWGDQIGSLSSNDLKEKLKKVKIFARVTPQDKVRIVQILEEMNYSVAVTGDGVNDAPALKTATVGIAMGIRGTDVSKEAADIVLADDNYSTIVEAVAWGRKIYDNIRNALIFLLAGNFDEIFLIALSFIFGLPAPFTAIQILWVNLVTDPLPAISLALEKPDLNKVMKENPRPHKTSSFSSSLWYAVFLGVFSLMISIVLYLWGLHHSVDKARTLVFLAVILCEMVYVLSIRAPKRIWQDFRGFFGNVYLNIAILISIGLGAVTLLPRLRPFFNTTSLNFSEMVALFLGVSSAFVMAEIFRYFYDIRRTRKK